MQDVNPLPAPSAVNSVAVFFEGVGVYVKRGLIDVSMVDDLMSEAIMSFCDKSKPIIYETRTRNNLPQFGEFVEHLANEVKAIIEKQHPKLAT